MLLLFRESLCKVIIVYIIHIKVTIPVGDGSLLTPSVDGDVTNVSRKGL